MADTIAFSDSFTVSETKGAQSATVKRTVALKEILPGNDRMFSRVYVSKHGIVTGGVFAEDAGLPDDPKFGGHEGMRVPAGTSEQRPADGKAIIRYNTELQAFEANEGGDWILPFQGVNLKAIETDVLPKVQAAQVYQVDLGNRTAPFKSGAVGKMILIPKAVLSDEDRAADVLVNKNGTLYFGGIAIGGLQPAGIPAATDTVLGGVMIGEGIEVQTDGTISIEYFVKASASDSKPGTLFNKMKGIGGIALSVVNDPTLGAQVVIDGSGIDTAPTLPANADYLSTDTNSLPVGQSLPANAAMLGTDANKKIVSKSIPLATAGAAGIVKVGAGLSINGSGELSASVSVPLATTSTVGTVKVGSGLAVDAAGSVSVPVASAGTAGIVKVGAGLAIDGSGALSASLSVPLATTSTVGTVKIGAGLAVDAAGSVTANIPLATTSAVGTVKVGAGLSVDGAGAVSTKLADMPDVASAGATNGQSLKLNTTTNKWEPYTPPTITVSTAAPSGTPADGAIWFQVGA